jgi:predicted DNA repair protein MutK
MTVGVYGLVAGIVKLDDAGLAMTRKPATALLGRAILVGAPWMMKALSLAGLIAIFLVGGGIVAHGVPFIHHFAEGKPAPLKMLIDGGTGLVVGSIVVALVMFVQKLRKR